MASDDHKTITASAWRSEPAGILQHHGSHRQLDRTAILMLAASAITTMGGHLLSARLGHALSAAMRGIAVALS